MTSTQTRRTALSELERGVPFADRHIGPDADGLATMLAATGASSLDDLAARALPDSIRDAEPVATTLPPAAAESEMLGELRALADRNTVTVPMIGLGYHGTRTPAVIRRNVLENPAWYTAYTPYQPEISQGRLEALLAFQTTVSDLTGLPVAGASLLDEATAAAEAMTLLRRAGKSTSPRFVVDADTLPQTLDVLRTRAEPLGIELVVADVYRDPARPALPDGEMFGVLLSYPGASGRVADPSSLIADAHDRGALVVVAADLLACALLTPPGELGADAAVGNTQRFGVPLGFGGPHAGYLSVGERQARQLPGRLVGMSRDADGNPALRLALQTREQHIRREKATSNICTAQVLLAVIAACYAAYHGPDGLERIARRTHRMTAVLAAGLRDGGVELVHDSYFDTVVARVPGRADAVVTAAHDAGIALRRVDPDHVGVSCSELTTVAHLRAVWAAFGVDVSDVDGLDAGTADALPDALLRTSEYLTHPTFHDHRSETAMMRWLRRLADADLALDRTMIPLGSCTMKLNAAAEMEPVTWPEFAELHPLAPEADSAGTREMITQLERWLAELTGYHTVSVQPNAGSQGELAGLLAIAAYHRSRGDHERDVCLIPSSAHGTNAASAVMAGLRVVVVGTDARGDVDLDDLHAKIAEHGDRLAALMITYPSTHGVYEAQVGDVCRAVHDAGGQVYVDGANLNALVGVARPGAFGGDVSHLNLHKTFCIPHGGGGPGVGPVAVAEHLAPFLPGRGEVGQVSAARYGSPGVLPISWAYLRMMGPDGLRRATLTAVAAANYVARRLREHFPVLYAGADGSVAHECILDLRRITKETGVTVDDVAKRLIDYGIHAPTMSFPVAGTLMVEPTESEDVAEVDRFVDAMIGIRGEIDRVAAGEWPVEDNPLRGAPHTVACLVDKWDRAYPRELAAYPTGATPGVHDRKVWPPVRRIDGAHGDRNLVCSCPPPDAFA
ncbi:MAG: aminomethyl-transferring glycine dehydrogenase [Actinomycetota bacterium]|nr:aminomethyl-transferring glycine dehydrogenase [Actinomycetota bacterium]